MLLFGLRKGRGCFGLGNRAGPGGRAAARLPSACGAAPGKIQVLIGHRAPFRLVRPGPNPLGQVGGVQDIALAEGHRPLHHVLQLSDVARKGVAPERIHKRRGWNRRRTPQAGRVPTDEPGCQELQVAPTVPEGRQCEREGLQAVEEVPAEASLRDGRGQVLVCGGHDTNVKPHGPVAPHGPDRPLLEDTKELGLERRGHLADLVQEETSALRFLKEAAPGACGSRERSSHVPEELTLQEGLGHPRAVDRQKRSPGPGALGVDGPRRQLLAHAAFS